MVPAPKASLRCNLPAKTCKTILLFYLLTYRIRRVYFLVFNPFVELSREHAVLPRLF